MLLTQHSRIVLKCSLVFLSEKDYGAPFGENMCWMSFDQAAMEPLVMNSMLISQIHILHTVSFNRNTSKIKWYIDWLMEMLWLKVHRKLIFSFSLRQWFQMCEFSVHGLFGECGYHRSWDVMGLWHIQFGAMKESESHRVVSYPLWPQGL